MNFFEEEVVGRVCVEDVGVNLVADLAREAKEGGGLRWRDGLGR